MSDPDHETEPEVVTNPRYDNWPVQRYDAYTDLSVERATPRDEGDDIEWIGYAYTGEQGTTPYVFDNSKNAIYQGGINDENERIVLREADRRDVKEDESLGEHIEEIGEEHDWQWLSSFAREHLEDDESADELLGDADTLELEESDFNRRNLLDSSPADIAFQGSHTMTDASGRVRILERRFDVTIDESGFATVDVEEYYLVAEEPRETERAGDAEMIEEREYRLEQEFDPDAPNLEAEIEAALQQWHETHVGWPDIA